MIRCKERKVRLYFRADAALASPEVYEFLEANGFLYVIRLPANRVLQESIAHLLNRGIFFRLFKDYEKTVSMFEEVTAGF